MALQTLHKTSQRAFGEKSSGSSPASLQPKNLTLDPGAAYRPAIDRAPCMSSSQGSSFAKAKLSGVLGYLVAVGLCNSDSTLEILS